MAPRSNRDELHGLGSSTLPPSAECALGRSAEAPAFQAGEASSTLAGHLSFDSVSFGDRLKVGCLALNQVMEVQVLLPELQGQHRLSQRNEIDPRQLLLVVTLGSEPGGRWFDSTPRNLSATK